MVLKDYNGNSVYTITASTKGTTKLGDVKRAGETKKVITLKEGDTFFLVSDSLPDEYGGFGTDILLGMEKADFHAGSGGALINFQVKHTISGGAASMDPMNMTMDMGMGMEPMDPMGMDSGMMHMHGMGTQMVQTQGTRFDDVIDLRAGKKSTDSGFGGFNDHNTGMDIWDAGFFTQADSNLAAATTGFDLYNWKPKEGQTAENGNTAVTSIINAYQDASAHSGTFNVYKVETGKDAESNPIYMFIAWDTSNESLFGEVVKEGQGWKEKLEGVTATTKAPAAGSADVFGWQPGPNDNPVAKKQKIKMDDGTTSHHEFDIYLHQPTNQHLALQTEVIFFCCSHC